LSNKVTCQSCKEDTTEYLFYTLIAKDGSKIIICDSCYQEISRIQLLGNKRHLEYVEQGNKRYFNTIHWKKLKISWEDVTEC
jgi:protein-arginine kinase activator protein McsA